jgi:hypothetical protein
MAIQDYLFSYAVPHASGQNKITDMRSRSYRLDEIHDEAAILPQRKMNSFYQDWFPWAYGPEVKWEPRDFVAHMALVEKTKRLDVIKNLLSCFEDKGGKDYQSSDAYFDCGN